MGKLMQLNDDVTHVQMIRHGIMECQGHCPCVPRHLHVNSDTICPCKKFREERICECDLYIVRKTPDGHGESDAQVE